MKTRTGPVSTPSVTASRSPAPAPAPAPPAHDSAPQPLSALQRNLVGGAALPADLRTRMETGFGASFADVRIHTGGAAAQATGRMRAEALTSGRDIAFAPGRYQPGSKAGDSLIAHELAHVVQQRRSGGGGAVQAKSLISNPGEAAESAADTAAATVLAGGRAQLGAAGQSLRGRIMRRALAGAAPFASRAMTQAPARPGAVAPGSGPVLTPVMTSQVSAAGGRISGMTKPGAAAPATKAPDEAQTARGGTGAEAKPAPSVAIAGAPAGAGEAAATQGTPKTKARDAQKPEAEKPKARSAPGKGGARAQGGGGGGGAAKRFGQDLGDRGETAADEARERLSRRADALQVNEGADSRIVAARAAAEPTPNAAEADGQGQQAAALSGADIPAPDAAAAQQRAGAALASAAPSTIEELDNFVGPGGAGTRQRISQQVGAEASRQAAPVQSSMAGMQNPPQGAAPPPAVPQPEPVAAPSTPAPGLTGAAPAPVPDESLDASEFRESADAALAEHDVDDATLAKAEEGPLRAIGDDKDELNENVDSAASNARATESAATQEAAAGLAATEADSTADMEAGRDAAQEAVSGEQTGARLGEETGAHTLAEQINATYTTAEGQVNARLGTLESDAVQGFRDRQGQRLESFASGVRADLEAFKSRRYSGARGLYNRARDWVLSINSLPEVKALYDRHRNQYIADIDALLAGIRASIQRTIDECRTILSEAKTAIDQLAETNKGNLDAEAQAALTRAHTQFQAMESRIEATQRSALAALDRERERAIREMDAKLAEIQAENAGLVDRIAAAIKAIADALGEFMALLARVTRMGVGRFLSAAGSQAQEGVKNHLWDSLKEAFKQWFFNKVPGLQLLMNLPPNWVEMLTALASSMIGLITENLPALMPAMAAAAMTWLAVQLALKLIPGAGAIMAVIDAIRAAWSLVQSLFSAARAFLEFVMQVAAPGNGAAAFARALAHGIVAAVDMVLTFLGIDALIRRLLGAIARPFGRIIARIQQRFRQYMARRRARRQAGQRRRGRRDDGRDAPGSGNRRRGAAADARRRQRASDRRRARRNQQRDRNRDRRRESPDARRRREREERERRNLQRLNRAKAAIDPAVRRLLRNGASRTRLSLQMTYWRLRWRLTTLALAGRSIRLSINPSTELTARIEELDAQQLGGLLEPILREAEDRFFQQRYAANPELRRNVEGELGTARRTGSVNSSLADADRVQLYRGIAETPMQHRYTSVNVNRTMAAVGSEPARSFPVQSRFTDNPAAPWAVRPGEVRHGGSYSAIQNRMNRPGRGGPLGVGTYLGQRRGKTDPAWAGVRSAEIRLMEAARGPGQFATQNLASGLIEATAFSPEGMAATRAGASSLPERLAGTGDLNFAVGQGTGRTMDYDAGRRSDSAGPNAAQNRARRRISTAELMRTINRVRPAILSTAGERGAALNHIRTQFRNFMRAAMAAQQGRGRAGAEDRAREQLIAAVAAFMHLQNRT